MRVTICLVMLTIGPLLTVFCLLAGRTTAVRSRDVLLFLGFGLHLAFIGIFPFTASAKGNTILQNTLEIVFAYAHINDGINVLQ